MTDAHVGKPVPQVDSFQKVTGTALYTYDVELPGMLYAKLVTSSHPHANIVSIDASKAAQAPGVVAVATGKEFPFRIGIYIGDRDVLALDKVRWVGHPVAAVVAESMEAAERGAEQVEVEYEALPSVFDPLEALKREAPILHAKLGEYRVSPAFNPLPGTNVANKFKMAKGDVGKGLREADLVLEETFTMPHVTHAFMETQAVVAHYHKDGTVEVWTSAQSPFTTRYLMALSMGMPIDKVVIKQPLVGGGFGGKAGLGWEPLVALLSKLVGFRPVKLVLSRREQFASAAVREAFRAEVKAGFKKDGTLHAYKARFILDAGGYADYTVNVCRAAGYSAEGPYEIRHVYCESLAVYTNKVPTTAMRGFGYPESHWALERIMDIAAAQLGLDPVHIRMKNLVKPGVSETATGERLRADAGKPEQVLKAVAAALEWDKPSAEPEEPWKFRGKGLAVSLKGPAQPPNAGASAILKFNEDVSVDLMVGTGSFGQGTPTALAQLVGDAFGIPVEKVRMNPVRSTDGAAYTWQTVGSRGLFTDGNAVLAAIEDAKKQIRQVACQVLRVPEGEVEVAGGVARVRGRPWLNIPLSQLVFGYVYPNGNTIGGPVIGRGTFMSTLTTYLDPETGQGIPTIFHTFGCSGVEIEVDALTGEIKILKAAQSFDIGKAINPLLVKGQMDGGFLMGQSVSLFEQILFDEQGWVLNPNFSNYYLLRSKDVPNEITGTIVENPQSDGPLGARGLGEMVMIGVAPAIANALYRALGIQITNLPMNPENVWRAIRKQKPELLEKVLQALWPTKLLEQLAVVRKALRKKKRK